MPHLSHLWSYPMLSPPTHLGDVIMMEQRGVGQSRPSLVCPGTYEFPLDAPGSPDLFADVEHRYLEAALTFWTDLGIDPGGYNVLEMAADTDDLRQALGYQKISLLGGSFGSHHGLAILARYPQSVHRAFLWSIEGPDHTVKLPGNIQLHLQKLDNMARNDPFISARIPNLLALMAEVLDGLERAPVNREVIHPVTNERCKVAIGKYDLQRVTANGLGSTRFMSELPARYVEMARGDFSWLASRVIEGRVNLQASLMFALTDYSSGASSERRDQVSSESSRTLLGDSINDLFLYFDDLFGEYRLDDGFRDNYFSDTDALLVSGTLDARTPLTNAQELLPRMPQARAFEVIGGSHDLARRGSHVQALADLRDRFLVGEKLATATLEANFSFEHAYEIFKV